MLTQRELAVERRRREEAVGSARGRLEGGGLLRARVATTATATSAASTAKKQATSDSSTARLLKSCEWECEGDELEIKSAGFFYVGDMELKRPNSHVGIVATLSDGSIRFERKLKRERDAFRIFGYQPETKKIKLEAKLKYRGVRFIKVRSVRRRQ